MKYNRIESSIETQTIYAMLRVKKDKQPKLLGGN